MVTSLSWNGLVWKKPLASVMGSSNRRSTALEARAWIRTALATDGVFFAVAVGARALLFYVEILNKLGISRSTSSNIYV